MTEVAPKERLGPILMSLRAAWREDRVVFARAGGFSRRSLQRWELHGITPRDKEKHLLVGMVARRDYAAASRIASVLGIAPPPDLAPKPIVAPPLPERALPEPSAPPAAIPDELVVHPIEVALFRAAESLAMSPAELRPVLARFLGHVAALGMSPSDARDRLDR